MARFAPGKSGNPNGRPKLPADIVETRKLTTAELVRVLSACLSLTPQEIMEKAQDPNTKAMELAVLSVLQKAITDGDSSRLNFLFDRVVGKVPDKIEINPFEAMTTEELLVIAREKIPELEKK